MNIKKQDERIRMYEHGKSAMAQEVYQLLTDTTASGNLTAEQKLKKFTKDFCKQFDAYIPRFGDTKPTKYEKKFCYLTTYEYRGFKVKVYDDDYGQQFYFYFNNINIGCGAYNLDYESCIRHEVDEYLDLICRMSNIDIKYAGAELRYANHEHTEIVLNYRLEELYRFYLDTDKSFDIDDIKQKCQTMLDTLFSSEEFKKSEEERRARGDLYFYELIEQMESEEED